MEPCTGSSAADIRTRGSRLSNSKRFENAVSGIRFRFAQRLAARFGLAILLINIRDRPGTRVTYRESTPRRRPGVTTRAFETTARPLLADCPNFRPRMNLTRVPYQRGGIMTRLSGHWKS